MSTNLFFQYLICEQLFKKKIRAHSPYLCPFVGLRPKEVYLRKESSQFSVLKNSVKISGRYGGLFRPCLHGLV